MDKISAWIISNFRHPLSLLIFALGSLLILLGVTTSLEVPVLQQLVPDENFKWVSLITGAIFLAVAIFIYYRPPQELASQEAEEQASIPEELTRNFTSRRAGLSQSQTRILAFIEYEGFGGSPVSQDTIEANFNKYGKSEIYYRLEHLRLLGFLEKQVIGQDRHTYDRFTYRLSTTYQKELGGVRGAHT